jgi:hypothetical protein
MGPVPAILKILLISISYVLLSPGQGSGPEALSGNHRTVMSGNGTVITSKFPANPEEFKPFGAAVFINLFMGYSKDGEYRSGH